jgi:hypothetical protein
VVLANAKHVQPNLVGPFDAFEQLAHGLRTRNGRARAGTQQVRGETVNSYFHGIWFVFWVVVEPGLIGLSSTPAALLTPGAGD